MKMIFMLSFILFVNLSSFYISWYSLNVELLLIQIITIYFLHQLSSVKNSYQLIGYMSLTLVFLGINLFYLQFDVYACFLLIAESIVMLFALSILMHLNVTNRGCNSNKPLYILPIAGVLVLSKLYYSQEFVYWVDWYTTKSSQFNDLLPQYYYFFDLDISSVFLIGLWLVVITILLVHLILTSSTFQTTETTSLSYTRKAQNVWTQWYKKPVLRFFNK